jgi:hypothetical protein
MSLLGNQFSKVRKAAKVALSRTGKITGSGNNPLSLYEKLTPVHFDAIAKVYGQDNLMKYIKTMEAKKIRGEEDG